MDAQIKRVQHGTASYDDVYSEVLAKAKKMCYDIYNSTVAVSINRDNEKINECCPFCHSNLIKRKYSYSCPSEDCGFKISNTIAGKEITDSILKTLLSGKSTATFKFKKKDGTPFSGRLKLVNGEVVFDMSSGVACPICKMDIRINKGGAFCDGCGAKIFRKQFGVELTDKELKRLLTSGETDFIDRFISKKTEKSYKAKVVLNSDGSTRMEFPNR